MRLYIKLFAMILLAICVQRFCLTESDAPPSQLWFSIRCSYAQLMEDNAMIQRLVNEAHAVDYASPARTNARSG
jgi:hypothetical protein